MTGRMTGIEVAVMTSFRAGAVESFFFMTGVTGGALIDKLAVGSTAVNPA